MLHGNDHATGVASRSDAIAVVATIAWRRRELEDALKFESPIVIS
jgi:hypothetical protein